MTAIIEFISDSGSFSVLPPDADYVIELAARCREMGGRLSELNESVKELDGLIRGGILAIGESDE